MFAPADRTCRQAHVFTNPGMYTIKLTVTDDDGGSATAETMVVVYDPDGGFATSGAHLDSPAGSLTSDPQASGRLNVQMNPMYKPGDTGPVPGGGRISTSLQGAGMVLESTALSWLVITPDYKVAVKGVGTVNGASGYGFIVYGYDDPDRLRLVVWPLSAGENPGSTKLYDNRAVGGWDLDVADPQPLSGGSLQVHQ
ncbi:PKD domain-containing protein [Micromonospora sp. U21]|nr:PKD domain-containing protein [Micromonospora sp. U21]